MENQQVSDFERPYGLMAGVWTGLANEFTAEGEFVGATPSTCAIYWHDEKTLHFRQDLDPKLLLAGEQAEVSWRAQLLSFELNIDGKHCRGENPVVNVEGYESMPGIYMFHLTAKNGSFQQFNNQYFINENQRNIIGPFLNEAGTVKRMIAQSFQRMSFDVPARYRDD